MKLYIDLILLINYVFDYLSLYTIEKLFSDKIYYLRIIVSSLIGSSFIISIFISNILYILLKIFGGVIIVMIGIKTITFSKQIIKISLFYTLNFAFTGFMESFGITKSPLIFLGFGLILGLVILESNKKYFIFLSRYNYKINITLCDKKIQLIGFLDTGNEATYEDKPIVFINRKYKKILREDYQKYKSIDILTVNGIKKQDVYKPQDFTISVKKKEYHKEVLIVFSDINKDSLINPYVLL